MDTPVPAALPVAQVTVAAAASPKDEPIVQAVLVDDGLPRFTVDFLVRKPTMIGKDGWNWHQFVIHGQQLEVYDKTKGHTMIESYETPQCTMQDLSAGEHTLQLLENGEPRIIFFCPSATTRDRFLHIFASSTTTPNWVKPASTVLDDAVAVAKAIIETDASMKSSPIKTLEVAPSGVTVDQVQSYIKELKVIYDAFPVSQSKADMYEYVLNLEADFLANPARDSLIHRVLRLYPDEAANNLAKMTTRLDCSKCPHCDKPFIRTAQMNLHVGGRTLICDKCDNWVHYESFKVGQLRKAIATFDFKIGIIGFQKKRSLPMPTLPRDGKASTYMKRLWRIVFEDECQVSHHRVPYKAKFELEERMMAIMNRLDLVQLVYRHLLFASQIVTHMDYWNNPTVIQAAILRYDRFRHLATAPEAPNLAATMDIMLVSHVHQILSKEMVLPIDNGSGSLDVRLGDTTMLWSKAFNEPYSSCALDLEAWVVTKPGNEEVQHANLRKEWAKYCLIPSADCRFVGVQEVFPTDSLRHVPHLTGATAAVSVIGALETDDRIYRGKLRHLLPQDASRVYTYRYMREVRSLLEKVLAPGWY
ncbi:Aste57867_313 [Aphanomyces stellatus]|uniref:Aste57867_313 protein n=1 Tax=Aphanomyces stellatus TaxID=120398 RepID=A0A485K4T3_9STRA|nr:hypothetical protein As57867_000313 [Aphanomyces stellatus]VFT77539.1 Aste57867_313 [Aphanomyces stellatus]